MKLAKAAEERLKHFVIYDGSYEKIKYPMGDVSPRRGVCTDVVIRSLRTLGYDLQKLVHEDMRANFSKYPKNWGLKSTDKNIDHRRVPNLRKYLTRKHKKLPVTDNKEDYLPGDIVSWKLPNNLPHIGIVSTKKASDGTPKIVHNIGLGPQLENMLFDYDITGHYRFF